MNGDRDGWYRVSTARTTYGVQVVGGRIKRAVPIARGYMGWAAKKAFRELEVKYGAEVVRIADGGGTD